MAAKSQVRLATMATVLGSLAAAGLLGVLVVVLQDALLWLLIALFVAMVLAPAVERLSKLLPRGLSVGAVGLLSMGLLVGLGSLVVPPFVQQARDLVSSLPALLEELRASGTFRSLDERFAVGRALDQLLLDVPTVAGSAASTLLELVGGLMRFSFAAITIAFVSMFMLASGPALLTRLAALLEPPVRAHAERLWSGVCRATSRYAVGTGLVALLAGGVATATLAIAGVPYFLPLGASLVFLDLLPFVGAISGGVLLTLVTGLTVGWLRAVVVLAIFVVYQQLEGHLLLPLVHHRTVRLSALGVAVALLVGYELLGILGVLLAVPVAGALRVLADELLAARAEGRAAAAQPTASAERPAAPRGAPEELRP